MKAIILAAGYATRLYPLTKDKPKPLLVVAGKPMVEHILDKIKVLDEVDEIFIVANNKFYKHFLEWLDGFSYPKKIKIINDRTNTNEDRLGAIGDIDFVIKKENVSGDLLVIAGDNLFEFSLRNFIDYFKEKKTSVIALFDMKEKEKVANKFGVVVIDENRKVIDFEEKPAEPKSTLAATACYLYTKEDITKLKDYLKERESTDAPGHFFEYLSKQKPVYAFIFEGRWWDIGNLEQMEEADKEFKDNS